MRGFESMLVGVVLLALLAVIGGAGPASAQAKIVIYAAEDEKTTAALTHAFTEETKIGTEVIRVPAAGTLATRIRAEKAGLLTLVSYLESEQPDPDSPIH